eukprot:CAMPEP_0184522366 /NCGR_PEP_ID=MMETSP0198_2-20121128/8241_1 /TAXON_ID=1112570 /ORGANISM="Thraustochytrium sp., Strain LLF1b" /LENGTH=38 /DNA_ID= /DNA_START= /DNA_END= /DNA_ORIENTATION=
MGNAVRKGVQMIRDGATTLSLSSNNIGDEGAKHLGDAL